jgi:hypothetical protein
MYDRLKEYRSDMQVLQMIPTSDPILHGMDLSTSGFKKAFKGTWRAVEL